MGYKHANPVTFWTRKENSFKKDDPWTGQVDGREKRPSSLRIGTILVHPRRKIWRSKFNWSVHFLCQKVILGYQSSHLKNWPEVPGEKRSAVYN